MNSPIIFDYLRRWGALIAVITLVYGTFTAMDTRMTMSLMVIPLFMFTGPVGLSMDLRKGLARTLMMLPVPRRQLTQTFWFLGVGLPIIWLITVTTLATAIATTLNISEFPSNPFHRGNPFDVNETSLFLSQLQLYASVFAAFSVMYFAMTGLPTSSIDAQDHSPRSMLFGGLWGLSIGGSMWLVMYAKRNPNISLEMTLLLALGGCAFSYWGFKRTDEMLSLHSTGRGQSKRDTRAAKGSFFEADSKATGFRHLTATTLTQTAIFTVIYLVFVFVINFFVFSRINIRSTQDWLGIITQTMSSQGLIFVVMPSFLLAAKLQTARVFRSLPLTASDLANRFTGVAMLCLIQQCTIAYLLVGVLGASEQAKLILFEFFMLGGVGTLCLPLLLRFGMSPSTFGIAFPVFMLFSMGRIFAPEWFGSWRGAAIGFGAIILCRQLIAYLLANSSGTYRKISSAGMATPFYGKG